MLISAVNSLCSCEFIFCLPRNPLIPAVKSFVFFLPLVVRKIHLTYTSCWFCWLIQPPTYAINLELGNPCCSAAEQSLPHSFHVSVGVHGGRKTEIMPPPWQRDIIRTVYASCVINAIVVRESY